MGVLWIRGSSMNAATPQIKAKGNHGDRTAMDSCGVDSDVFALAGLNRFRGRALDFEGTAELYRKVRSAGIQTKPTWCG